MDKTTWIVVATCLGLLGANYYYKANQRDSDAVSPVAPAAISAPAQLDAAASSIAAPLTPATANSLVASTPAAATPVAPAPAIAKDIATLVSHDSNGKAVARYVFQNIGGSVKYVDMVGKSINSTKEELLRDVRINDGASQGIGTLMFGLSSNAAPRYDDADYKLIEATDKQVTLEGMVGNLVVRKIYRLKPLQVDAAATLIAGNAYVLKLDIVVLNSTKQLLEARNWGIYAGSAAPISSSEGAHYTYYVTLEDSEFTKEKAGSFDPWFSPSFPRVYDKTHQDLEWAGTMNQYYASLIKPAKGSDSESFYAAPIKQHLPITGAEVQAVELGMGLPDFLLSPATPKLLSYDIFTGPKLNMMLEDMSSEYRMIDRIMDYGWLAFISYPMNWLINVFYGWFGNWGWAIVAMTIVVRILIWPLYRKSYMSMKRMSLLQPEMKELKEKYPNDPQRVNVEMMKLYKKYGVSPLGGCLPMFLQIPIFFAFFYVLQTAAEFRDAPFIGWVHDLSQMDTVATLPIMGYELPINILPILMAVSMVVQMRMTPQAGDPMQQKIMKLMPIMFFFFCYTYPSALALYWTTQNIVTIVQTWFIQRMPLPALTEAPKKKGAKKGFLERMMESQQAALAEQQKRAAKQDKEKNMRNVTRK